MIISSLEIYPVCFKLSCVKCVYVKKSNHPACKSKLGFSNGLHSYKTQMRSGAFSRAPRVCTSNVENSNYARSRIVAVSLQKLEARNEVNARLPWEYVDSQASLNSEISRGRRISRLRANCVITFTHWPSPDDFYSKGIMLLYCISIIAIIKCQLLRFFSKLTRN